MKTLPDKPSELILLALDDLARAEADPRYRINMSVYHINDRGVCRVCLAGAVMAGTLGADPESHQAPSDFDQPLRAGLEALNDFRVGNVELGLMRMGCARSNYTFRRWIPPYHTAPEGFKTRMRALAADLEEAGL